MGGGGITEILLILQQSVTLLSKVAWIHKKNTDACSDGCWNSGSVKNIDQCAVMCHVLFHSHLSGNDNEPGVLICTAYK